MDAGDEVEEREDGGEVEVGWMHCLESEEGVDMEGIMEITVRVEGISNVEMCKQS